MERPEGSRGAPPALRASDAEREAAIVRLNAACGAGRLTLEEFGERMEAAQTASSRPELDGLLADLPAERASAPSPPARTDWHVAPIGGLRREGRWRMAARTVAVTLVGGARLDLREAELAGPEATLTLVTLVGGVRLEVPPGVRVEVGGVSLLGGRRVEIDEAPDPGAPVLRVRAFSLVGGVRIDSTRPRRLRP